MGIPTPFNYHLNNLEIDDMNLHLIDGNNVLRRMFETEGPYWAVQAYIQASQGVSGHGQIIWVWDGEGAKKYRQEIWPAYKMSSDSTDEFYLFMDKFRELLKHSKAMQIRIPGYEADDVISEICRMKEPETRIFIDSNDQDYRQLLIHSGVTLDYMSEKLKDVPADEIRLYKTLVGDKSDEIKGLTRFGEKAWPKLTHPQKDLIEEFIQGETDLTVDEIKDKLSFSDSLANNLFNQREELAKVWKIVGFRLTPWTEINSRMQLGVLNTSEAQTIFDELAIPVG